MLQYYNINLKNFAFSGLFSIPRAVSELRAEISFPHSEHGSYKRSLTCLELNSSISQKWF